MRSTSVDAKKNEVPVNMQPHKEEEKSSKPSLKDVFRLRYFRFKSIDLDLTLDFYTTLGMNLDFKTEQTVWVNPNKPVKARNTTNQMRSKKDEIKDDEGFRGLPIISKKNVLGFSFRSPGSVLVDPNENIQLIFEKDISMKALGELESKRNTYSDEKDIHNYEYLVIYVHFIDRIVKRLGSKGFRVKMNTKTLSNVKIAIVKDPNGIEIRLLEMTPEQLNEANIVQKRPWFARLGYYTVPSTKSDECIDFYESIFNIAKTKEKEAANDMSDFLNSMGDKSKKRRNGLRKSDNSPSKAHLSQFRLIDSEEFVIGLIHTSYYWMGNDARTSACSLCFTERSDVDATFDKNTESPKMTLLLLSVGFHVSNLESSVNKVKGETRNLIWEDARYLVNKVGLVARFWDKLNNIWVELFTSKIPELPKVIVDGMRSLKMKTGSGDGKDDIAGNFIIKRNHLKGHARTLSEGAIYRIKSHLQEDEELTPSKNISIKQAVKFPSAKW